MGVKVGLVGLGVMGTIHFKAFQEIEGAEVRAVCDLLPERLKGDWASAAGNIDTGAARQTDLTAIETYASFGRMLRKADVDMIDVCLPTHLHAKFAIAALKAGKHVFCEKPMALTSRQCRRIADAAEQAGRFLMIGHVLRFCPEYVWMKEAIDTSRYGRVKSVVLRRIGGIPHWGGAGGWFADSAKSGNAALDLHIHDVDTVQWFFGQPRRVSSQGAVEADGGVRHIITQYYYDDGKAVVAEGGWLDASHPFFMSATIFFERATVGFDSRQSPTLVVYAGSEKETPAIGPAEGYTEELRYFVNCVSSGVAPRRITPSDAAAAVALVEAEIKSVKTARAVKVQK